MLQRVRLTDFKSFVDEEVTLGPLTILLGANASGKSNFLDAFRFLQQTPSGRTLREILDGDKGKQGSWVGIRGGSGEIARVGTDLFSIESTWSTAAFQDLVLLLRRMVDEHAQRTGKVVQRTHRIDCEIRRSGGGAREVLKPLLHAESIGLGTDTGSTFRTGNVLEDVIEVPWPPVGGASSQTAFVPRSESLLSIWERSPLNRPDILAPSYEAMFEMASAFGDMRFPNPEPARMRGYGQREVPLQEDGSNFSGVLANLCADPNEKRSLVDWLSELCAPEIADIDFIEVPELRDVMAVLVEENGKRISARSLSDGTLRFLGLLLSLRTAPPGSVVFLEDIESHLHPTRIKLLVEYLDAVTRTRGVQVVATTHSPVVLQWLKKDALGDAIVFGRVPEREGTVMRRLADLPDFEEVSKLKGVDELFTTGWLEMAL